MNTPVKILISGNADSLKRALSGFEETATVEAEYGDQVVQGSRLTLAHHGSRSHQLNPCLYEDLSGGLPRLDAIGISHIDLDTLGGICSIIGNRFPNDKFWKLVAHTDRHGRQNAPLFNASRSDIRRLYACHAWLEDNNIFVLNDGNVHDVTTDVHNAIGALILILKDTEYFLVRGDQLAECDKDFNKESFVERRRNLIVRKHVLDSSNLFIAPDGSAGKAVLAYDRSRKVITMNYFEEPTEVVTALAVMQSAFGEHAAGGRQIATSPKGCIATEEQFTSLIEYAALAAR